MGRPFQQLIDPNLDQLLIGLQLAFDSSGQALQGAVRSDIADAVRFNSHGFQSLKAAMETQLVTDLCEQNGPVARELKVRHRLIRSLEEMERRVTQPGFHDYIGHETVEEKALRSLPPRKFVLPKNFWYELLNPYFRRQFYDNETRTQYLTSSLMTQNKVGDGTAEKASVSAVKFNGTGSGYTLTMEEVQDSGSRVQYVFDIPSDEYGGSINSPRVEVLHDALEDATYPGTLDMLNPEFALSKLYELMVNAGWCEETHIEEGSYTAEELQTEIALALVENPVAGEINSQYVASRFDSDTYRVIGDKYTAYWTEPNGKDGEKVLVWVMDVGLNGPRGRFIELMGHGNEIVNIRTRTNNGRQIDTFQDVGLCGPNQLRFSGHLDGKQYHNPAENEVLILDAWALKHIAEEFKKKHARFVKSYTDWKLES